MKIPEKVKIGGKVYTVTETKNLYLGSVSHSAEILDADSEIHIYPMEKSAMEVAFLHELIHGIYYFLGYVKHNEKKIEELAQALYMVIQDNPEIFAKEMDNQNDSTTTSQG